MTWSTTEIEYEGFPLLLRKPDIENVWQFKQKFTQLISVEHILDRVESNGLPENKYNSTLADFDNYMCTIFEDLNEGLIFLVETFGGKRNYYYYTVPGFNLKGRTTYAKGKFNVNLGLWVKDDNDYGFLKTYPIILFE